MPSSLVNCFEEAGLILPLMLTFLKEFFVLFVEKSLAGKNQGALRDLPELVT